MAHSSPSPFFLFTTLLVFPLSTPISLSLNLLNFHFTTAHSSPSPFFLFTTLLVFPLSTMAQIIGMITVGTSLSATENSDPWRSPSTDFAFGFQQLQGNRDLYVLSIWFDKIPDKTIVWYEKNTDPVPRGSTVELDARDGLVLRDPQGRSLYNTTDSDGLDDEVAYAFMNDAGNLVLVRSDSSSLWESFRHPSDTILPTQTTEINDTLISRKTQTDFSRGRFYASMKSDGTFVLRTKNEPSNSDFDGEYYNTKTFGGNRVLFNETAYISVVRRDGVPLTTLSPSSIPPSSENYHRATLDFDGVFTQYSHPKNFGSNPQWSAVDSWPDNICSSFNDRAKGSGACGYNNVCTLNGDKRPVCQCLPEFSLADPNNTHGDCKPRFAQSCIDQGENDSVEHELLNISGINWPFNDYERIWPSTEEKCRRACLNDCFCAAAIYGASTACWKKRLPLSNGRTETTGTKAFLKLRKGDRIPLVNPKRDRQTLIIVVSVLLGGSVFINLLFTSAACLGFLPTYKKKLPLLNPARDTSGSNLRCFAYKELVQATDGFKEELGKGAFGIVYKGVMPDDSNTIVAVKKLDRVAQDSEKEFRTEVNVIGQIHHKNVVRLLGFCDEGPHRLLVYEYMSNGTLAGFLFADPKPSWSQRTQMALGVARGLTYLHEECSTQIIHCDIKPQNILLDDHYTARISDFGLGKLLMMNQSRTLTNIRGTKGYVAPEWFRNRQITAKVDVYSFGVVLLEIIACRKSVADIEFGDGENPILTDWAWDCFVERRLDTFVGDDAEALSERKIVERFVMVGIWCVQEDASLRPSMRKACQMLEGKIEVGVPPCPSSFISAA